MKETKLKERFENAVDAFFDNGKLDENTGLNYVNSYDVYQKDLPKNSNEKSNIFISILKQVFLFFPATFMLFIISFVFSAICVNNPYDANLPEGRGLWLFLWFSISIFMTWFGIGDVRKPRHFVIPASITSFGAITGLISGFLSIFFPEIIFSNNYPIYFFPIALVVPFIAKMFVDDLEEK